MNLSQMRREKAMEMIRDLRVAGLTDKAIAGAVYQSAPKTARKSFRRLERGGHPHGATFDRLREFHRVEMERIRREAEYAVEPVGIYRWRWNRFLMRLDVVRVWAFWAVWARVRLFFGRFK